MKKHWWKSKTIWVNVLAAAVAVAVENVAILRPLLPDNYYAIVAFVLPLVNVMLRVITTTGVK